MRSFIRTHGSRALVWGSALVLLAGLVAFVTVRLGTESTSPADEVAAQTSTVDGTDFLPGETTTVETSEVPKEARRVAGEFILAAVGREDLAKAWTLTHPSLKKECACSYEEWLTGNIPVQYYPTGAVEEAAFNVDEMTDDTIVLNVLLTPKQGSTEPQAAFFIGLKAVGKGESRQWLVDYWAPDSRPPVPQTS